MLWVRGHVPLTTDVLEKEPAGLALILDDSVAAGRIDGQAREDFLVDRALHPGPGGPTPLGNDGGASGADTGQPVDGATRPLAQDMNAIRPGRRRPELAPDPDHRVFRHCASFGKSPARDHGAGCATGSPRVARSAAL